MRDSSPRLKSIEPSCCSRRARAMLASPEMLSSWSSSSASTRAISTRSPVATGSRPGGTGAGGAGASSAGSGGRSFTNGDGATKVCSSELSSAAAGALSAGAAGSAAGSPAIASLRARISSAFSRASPVSTISSSGDSTISSSWGSGDGGRGLGLVDELELRGRRRRRADAHGRGRWRRGRGGRLGRGSGGATRPRQGLQPRDERARRGDPPALGDVLAHARQLIEARLDGIEQRLVGGQPAGLDRHDERSRARGSGRPWP